MVELYSYVAYGGIYMWEIYIYIYVQDGQKHQPDIPSGKLT